MKWINCSKNLPDNDAGEDYPKKYLLRVKGDDPRSGWVYVGYETVEEMKDGDLGEYAEWLDESNDGWIAVETDLPDNDDEVLVNMSKFGKLDRPSGYYLGCYCNGKWEVDGEWRREKDANNNPDYWLVTHWMPLPEPPAPKPNAPDTK